MSYYPRSGIKFIFKLVELKRKNKSKAKIIYFYEIIKKKKLLKVETVGVPVRDELFFLC